MWGLFGLDAESVAKNEVYDPTTGGYKEDIGDRLGNWIVGGLSGGSDRKAEIDKLTKAAHVKKLQTDYGTAIDKYGKVQGMETINADSLASLDSAQLGRKLNNNKETKDALSYVSETYGLDPSEFAGVTDASTIRGRGAKEYKDAEVEKVEQQRLKLKGEAETKLKSDRIYQEGLTTRQNERLDRKDAQAALLRSQEKSDALELRRDNMNMNYATMARRDRMDAKDRKDKNIMMLMQGLAGIATGFTV
jgi:hypothetical protein